MFRWGGDSPALQKRRSFISLAGIVIVMGLLATFLGACGAGTNDSFAKNADAAMNSVSGVVRAKTEYTNNPGMGSTVSVRIETQATADLPTVLAATLKAFAGASTSVKGATSVAYYVYAQGAEDGGIRPTAVGLKVTPTVEQIQDYAKNN